MNKRFHNDYKPLNKPWHSNDQGDIYPGMVRNGVLYTKFKSDTDCKNKTPDNKFKKGDIVRLFFNTKSRGMGYKLSKGDYIFDSYDSYDNTCYIKVINNVWNGFKNYKRALLIFNVRLDQIKKVLMLRYIALNNIN